MVENEDSSKINKIFINNYYDTHLSDVSLTKSNIQNNNSVSINENDTPETVNLYTNKSLEKLLTVPNHFSITQIYSSVSNSEKEENKGKFAK